MEKEKKVVWNKTRFTSKIRIDPVQADWIKKNKENYSLAGKLDEIINFYKKHNK